MFSFEDIKRSFGTGVRIASLVLLVLVHKRSRYRILLFGKLLQQASY